MTVNLSKSVNQWYVSVEDNFDFKSSEYASLYSESNATVFQSPNWLNEFYAKLVKALAIEPVIVTLRDKAGRLQLVLPCVRQVSAGIKLVQPADIGVSDYNCIVIRKDAIATIKADEKLQQDILQTLSPCDVFFFRKQRSDKPRIEDILNGASMSPADFNSYEVDLENSFDTWSRNNMSKQFRSTNRSKLRKLIAQCGTCDFETLTDKASIEEAMIFIRDTRSARYEGDLLLQPTFFEFYLSVALKYAQDGFAQTFVARVDGKIIAAIFGLNSNRRYCFLLCGFLVDEYGKFSIGSLTTSALISERIKDSSELFDFALGDENYKKRYNTTAIDIRNAVYARSTVGKLVSHIYQNAKPLKNWLKKFSPNLS
ncbi:GNAT family N-acetyltransferase [Lentilitoribacter sp. Alg239-R112]|uniref:GNAT family N-acetyltransferase n=1 Tax=Lentilitoribacter sp. Alg239-R112 TaxID=2305987 RepID=UPI0013A6CC18|nr:GNAT family N-acetyltransferase [Lentilitoribacter sp. Alg239-R112]